MPTSWAEAEVRTLAADQAKVAERQKGERAVIEEAAHKLRGRQVLTESTFALFDRLWTRGYTKETIIA